jgi:RNA polymerase sigma-70 factor (ECF subfamily)
MAQAQTGDEPAYVRLLGELAEAIKAYLTARFGLPDMVEDCVQECLIAIHDARHTYDSKRPFRPWMFAIVRHKTIDMLRTDAARRRVEDGTEPATTENAGSSALEASRLLDALSTDHREAVLLTKFWGFSVRESAARLGVSETVIKVRVHRAINKLRQLLEAEGL